MEKRSRTVTVMCPNEWCAHAYDVDANKADSTVMRIKKYVPVSHFLYIEQFWMRAETLLLCKVISVSNTIGGYLEGTPIDMFEE